MTRRQKLVIVNQTDVVRPEVDMLTQVLSHEDFEITVLLPESARSTLERIEGITYRFYRAWIVPNVRYPIPFPSFKSLLSTELRDASVLHVIGYIFLPSTISATIARRKDVRTIITVDAFPGVNWSYGNRVVDAIAKTYTHTLGRLTFKFADYVVGIGEYLRDDIERFTDERTVISVIPNGVDTKRYRPQATRKMANSRLGAEPGTTELLFVGRLDTVKGIPYLLHAFAALTEDGDYHLTLVGDGSRRDHYETLAETLEIADAVSFEGYRADVRPYYDECDIFVLPSLSEGLPTVLIEAQACGVPVVTTDVGGVHELVGGGKIVPKKDPAALRDAIDELSKSDLSHLGSVARRHVCSKYTLEGMGNAYTDLYRTAANATRRETIRQR